MSVHRGRVWHRGGVCLVGFCPGDVYPEGVFLGEGCLPIGVSAQRGCLPRGSVFPDGLPRDTPTTGKQTLPPEMATAAVGAHPTGMYIYLLYFCMQILKNTFKSLNADDVVQYFHKLFLILLAISFRYEWYNISTFTRSNYE